MPHKIYIGSSDRSGISIEWTPSTQKIVIDGWYDSMVGIEGESMTLREFFDRLKITEAHCRKAFAAKKETRK